MLKGQNFMDKTNKIYGVALIGCGHMGEAHLQNIYYKDNVKVVCVCDTHEDSAVKFKRKYFADCHTTSIDECISNTNVDIVICATYPSSHLEVLRKCIRHGKHLICEKPITPSLEEGAEFKELVKSHPEIKVLVGHILRHNHTYNVVADMISNGAIGHPIVMRMAQNHHTMDWQRYLELIKETSPIIDCGVHYIDLMQWFTGEKITEINGMGQRISADVPDDKYNYGMITVKLSDGSVGFYEAGWSNTMISDNLKEFIGPKGSIKVVFKKDRMSHQEEGDLIEYYKYPEKEYEIINVEGKRKSTDTQFDHLIDMIENDVPAKPSIDEVYDVFKIVMEADELIKNGKINI